MNTQELKKVQLLIDMWEEFRLFIHALGKDTLAIRKLAEFNRRSSLASLEGEPVQCDLPPSLVAQLQQDPSHWVELKTWDFYGPLWFEPKDQQFHFLALRGEHCIKHLKAHALHELLAQVQEHSRSSHPA